MVVSTKANMIGYHALRIPVVLNNPEYGFEQNCESRLWFESGKDRLSLVRTTTTLKTAT